MRQTESKKRLKNGRQTEMNKKKDSSNISQKAEISFLVHFGGTTMPLKKSQVIWKFNVAKPAMYLNSDMVVKYNL